MFKANHWTECRVSYGVFGEGTEGTEGVCSPMEEATLSTGETPGSPRDWTTNQRIHMKGPMVLVTYVAKDGLVEHQWKEGPLGLRV